MTTGSNLRVGKPETYSSKPAHVAGVHQGNRPGGTWLDWSGHRIHTNAEARVGVRVAFLIRQERIRLQTTATEMTNHIRGRVDHGRRRGKSRFVLVGIGNRHRIEVRSDLSDCASSGEEITVLFPPDAVWVFPEQGGSLTCAA